VETTLIPGSPATASLRHLLTVLGESGRTGALHVGGLPGGSLYLVAGRITYAESPACPGIGDRLVASGRISAGAWRAAYAEGAAGCRVWRLLVRGGHIGRNELACRVVAAICDATHALLQSDDAPVGFTPGERHPFGVVAQVELGALSHETAKRLLTVPAPRRGDARPQTRRAANTGSLRPATARRAYPPHRDAHGVRRMAAPWPEDGPR
jgi:Domain of unknown function (DUF4388)